MRNDDSSDMTAEKEDEMIGDDYYLLDWVTGQRRGRATR